MIARGEERFIEAYLSALSDGFPGAHGLKDDCAELAPLPGHSLVLKTDPIVEGVHFFDDDAPEDLGWKALAVNVSDLAAKAARPLAYLMALTVPAQPEPAWMERFANGLRDAQEAFGCTLIGGDTDCRPGPLSIAITIIGEVKSGAMVPRSGAHVGDAIYVTGELGGAALGLRLRLDDQYGSAWSLSEAGKEAALARYLRPEPRIGARRALQLYAHSAMDISDGLIKDLDRMCRLTGVGADLDLERLPAAPGVAEVLAQDRPAAVSLLTAGDDYEILATLADVDAGRFEKYAARAGVTVTRIGTIAHGPGVRLFDPEGHEIESNSSGYDHFDRI
ncbi:MAG: thiamine-phosphate kinase [Alphaproteobacteria bacterium]|nr:thiamine-phosphate kinase [Alphaproteobacteria bacterium]